MSIQMKPISISPEELTERDVDVLVIGSGYGGSIAAAKLAAHADKLVLLERGREILPGSYPTDLAGVRDQTEIVTAKNGTLTDTNGMMQIRLNADMHAVLGNGLGGGSLINAGVALRPDPRVFEADWPDAFKKDGELEPYFKEAMFMLGSQELPKKYNPPKLQALEVSAKAMGQHFERAQINVTFEDGHNAAGVFQRACTMCGDCCAGCNYGAKNTLLMNYLPVAHQSGATIVTQAEVRTIRLLDTGRYEVTVRDRSGTIDDFTIVADDVIVSAGAIGSTEILQRSQAETGLPLSKALGTRFSGNGDVLGFGFMANWVHSRDPYSETNPPPIYGIGAGDNLPTKPQYQPGPCITGIIKVDMTESHDLTQGLIIEEGVAPGALSAIYPASFFFDNVLNGSGTFFLDSGSKFASLAKLGADMEATTDPSTLCYTGALARSQSFLVMSHDTSGGKLTYNPDQKVTAIDWPGVGTQQPYPRDNAMLEMASDGIWATYLPNPIWSEATNHNLVTVHPVGGCPMSDDPEDGVVNDLCQAYTGDGKTLHPGLFIVDGSVIPTALGVNPLLTISAIAERAMEQLVTSRGRVKTTPVADTPPNAEESEDDTPVITAEDIALGFYIASSYLKGVAHDCETKSHRLAARELAQTFNRLIDRADIGCLAKLYNKFRFDLALLENNLKKDFGPAMDVLADKLARISHAGRHPPEGEQPTMALLKAILKELGDLSPALSFSEVMTGYVGPANTLTTPRNFSDPFKTAASKGRAKGQTIVGTLKIRAEHASTLLDHKDKKPNLNDATLSGTVEINFDGKSSETFTIKHGHFNLLKQDPTEVERWLMTYSGTLDDAYTFEGFKTLKRRAGSNWFGDITTLSVKLTPLGDRPALQGIMSLGMQDIAKQAGTIESGYDDKTDPSDLAHELIRVISDDKMLETVQDGTLVKRILMRLLTTLQNSDGNVMVSKGVGMIGTAFTAALIATFGKLIFRTYGGMTAYAYDFPMRESVDWPVPAENGGTISQFPNIRCKPYSVETADKRTVKLYRFEGGTKGPVIMASGFGTTALSYGMLTTKNSLLNEMLKAGFDVWLFDYRGGPYTVEASTTPFNLDDIAKYDWPAAIDTVLGVRTDATDVQVLGHCIGSMSLQMAVLGGYETRVRQMVSSQLTVHPVTNWFNMMKADTRMARFFVNGLQEPLPEIIEFATNNAALGQIARGLPTIQMSSDPGGTDGVEPILNALAWKVPFPYGAEPCYSPTCHRIFGIYGPAFQHSNLNELTHNAIKDIFGKVSTKPFEHLALVMRKGHAVDAAGKNVYLPHIDRLDFPIHFVAGANNLEFLPDTSLRTLRWLQAHFGPEKSGRFTREVFKGYAHMDCFIGKDPDNPVLKNIVETFEKFADPGTPVA